MAIQVSFPHDFRFLRVNLFLRIPSFCFHHRHQSPRPHTRLCGASLIGREPPFPTWTQPVPKRAGRLPKAVEMMLRIVVVFVSITEQGCSRRVGNRTHPPCFPIPTRERVKIHVGKSAFIPPYDHSTTESHRVLVHVRTSFVALAGQIDPPARLMYGHTTTCREVLDVCEVLKLVTPVPILTHLHRSVVEPSGVLMSQF